MKKRFTLPIPKKDTDIDVAEEEPLSSLSSSSTSPRNSPPPSRTGSPRMRACKSPGGAFKTDKPLIEENPQTNTGPAS